MGRGEIQSHVGAGRYNVKIKYAYRSRITAKLAALTEQINKLDAEIANPATDPAKLPILKLQKTAAQKLHDYYSVGMPEDPTVQAWCADLTEDLSGDVGTIEIPGEDQVVLIRPGYNSRADYTASRDGQLMPTIAGAPWQVLFNRMLLPGWQRYQPLYRIGTVSEIDYSANTATICLEPAYSSQQQLPAVDGTVGVECESDNPFDSQISDFCSRNPAHPLCTTTGEGSEFPISEQQLADLQLVNRSINQAYGRETDKSGIGIGDRWDVLGGAKTSGDCVACHEEIYTAGGIKKVGDLEVGDMALSYDFNTKEFCYKKITKIWEKGELPCLRVVLKNGHHIDITENHPMWARVNQGHGGAGGAASRYEKIYFKDIDLDRWWKRRLPIALKIPYQVRDVEWLNTDLCFIVGHYLAEGWREGGGVKVSTSGYEIEEYIIPLLEKNSVPFSLYKNSSGVPCVRFLKGDIKNFLKTLKSNSFDLHLPEFIFALPEPKLSRLLDGFYLGDGHNGNYPNGGKYISRKESVYSTSSEQFAYDLQRIGLQLGRSFHIWKQENHGGSGKKPIYRITHNLNSYFYRDHGWPGLSEVGIARTKIKQMGLVRMRDFTVEDTHTFVFKNGLVCHQCEDFALTKMQELVDTYGWPADRLKIVTGYAETGEYHAMVGVRTTNRGLVLLDVNNDTILQNGRSPYRLHRIGLTKDAWRYLSVRLTAVPVEYMSCNAIAFVAGDRVVVEFADQEWSQPKVIGFEEEPRNCEYKLYNFFHQPKGAIYRWDSWVLDLITRVTANTGSSSVEFRYGVASFRLGNGIYLCGGIKPRIGYSDSIKETLKFSPTSKSYATRTDMPDPARKDGAGFAVLARGLVVGGARFYDLDHITPYSDVDAYDDTGESWTSKTDCPVARMGHRGFELNGKAHVLCGSAGMFYGIDGSYHEIVSGGHRAYDLSTDSWQSKQEISEDRAYHQSCSLGGYGLTFGGRIDGLSNPNTKNNYKYNPDADSWAAMAEIAGTGFGFRYARGAVDTAYVPHSEGSYLEYSLAGNSFVGRTIEYPSSAEFYQYITGEIA